MTNRINHQPKNPTGELLNEVANAFKRHLVITPAQSAALALWSLHTGVYKKFQHTPRLAVLSPEKRCGKSILLDLLNSFSCDAKMVHSASEAAIFRLVEARDRITLLIDEADSFLPNHQGVRNVLNSGFEASGTTLRAVKVKDDFQPRSFKTFCPVAIAAIGELPDTVGDRAVTIRLRRKTEEEKVEKVRLHREAHAKLAERVKQWAAQVDLSADLDPDIPEAFGDRQADIAVPLLAIADHAGGEWPTRAREALAELFDTIEEESEGSKLLADLRTIFAEGNADKLPSSEICTQLATMEDRPWPEMEQGKPITPTQLARRLSLYQIGPRNIRSGEAGVVKGYHRADFEDAWKRYPPAAEAPDVAV